LSTTTELIAELVRAANKAEKLGKFERRNLLVRAVTTIRDMTAAAFDYPPARAAAEEIVDLQVQVAIIGARANTPEEVREALLAAAGMIRELHIVSETETEIKGA